MKRAHGYRSNFELDIANQLAKNSILFEYEKTVVDYIRECTYTPDFYIKEKDYEWIVLLVDVSFGLLSFLIFQ